MGEISFLVVLGEISFLTEFSLFGEVSVLGEIFLLDGVSFPGEISLVDILLKIDWSEVPQIRDHTRVLTRVAPLESHPYLIVGKLSNF